MLEEGTRVIIAGLQQASQHNGKEGVVLSFEPYASRYLVALPDGATISAKAENLLQSIGVTIVDLEGARKELNGRVGRVVGGDAERYHIDVLGQRIALKPSKVLLSRGAHVQIQGLQQTPQHNGQLGNIVDVDLSARRYVVELANEQQLRVRWECVRLAGMQVAEASAPSAPPPSIHDPD